MDEERADTLRPSTIIVRDHQHEEATLSYSLDREGLPLPVTAATTPDPPAKAVKGQHQSLIGVGLFLTFISPFPFLFLGLVPDEDQNAVVVVTVFSFILGLFCIALGASKDEPRESRPKTIVISNQLIEDKKVDTPSTPLVARSDNPWIDDGDETHSFWASMLEEQAEHVAAPVKQIKKEIPVSSDARVFSILYLICFLPVALLLIIVGGFEACGAIFACCLPELFLISLFDNSTTKSSPQDVHNQGLNTLLVIGIIALCLLMIIAFA